MNGLDYWARCMPSRKPPRLGVYGCSLAVRYLFRTIPAHAYRDATVSGYFGYVSNPRTACSPCGLRPGGFLPPRTSQSRTGPQCCPWVSRCTPARNCRADSPGCSQHGLCDAPMRARCHPRGIPELLKNPVFQGVPRYPIRGLVLPVGLSVGRDATLCTLSAPLCFVCFAGGYGRGGSSG